MHVAMRPQGSVGALGALTFPLVLALGAAGLGCTRFDALPAPAVAQTEPSTAEEVAIEQREICVGSKIASAGELGDTLYYRAAVLPDGKLAVGYYAFFSDERPWANNWLTWTVLPALAIDMVYTRTFFVAPGMRRFAHGKGDVEGFRVVYDLRKDGTLAVESAVADDGTHAPVHLTAAEVMELDPERPTLYTTVWSHQLGGRGVAKRSDLAYLRCFGPGKVRPLQDDVAAEFALGRRATPAHLEALGGRPVGAPVEAQAKLRTVTPRL